MTDWYLYADDGAHKGPVTTETLADAVAAGIIGRDAWTSADGSPGPDGWRRVEHVPELVGRLSSHPPARPSAAPGPTNNCYRIVDGAFTRTTRGTPEFGATMMLVGTRKAGRD